MAIKFLCDKAGCGAEIDQSQGGGTLTLVTKETMLDPQSKHLIPRLKQEEFQLCIKHAQEVTDFIRKEK